MIQGQVVSRHAGCSCFLVQDRCSFDEGCNSGCLTCECFSRSHSKPSCCLYVFGLNAQFRNPVNPHGFSPAASLSRRPRTLTLPWTIWAAELEAPPRRRGGLGGSGEANTVAAELQPPRGAPSAGVQRSPQVVPTSGLKWTSLGVVGQDETGACLYGFRGFPGFCDKEG